MAIAITVQTGAAPQGGTETYAGCTVPASQSAFQTAAAAALSASGGFISVTKAPDPESGISSTVLLNLNRIVAVN
jgi:hypothetical protein